METERKKDKHLPSRNLLEVMAMGLAVPVLIIPAMLIILNAPRMGIWWLPLLLAYLSIFSAVTSGLWMRKEKERVHFLVGDEMFYHIYPKELQKALRAARKEGIPPEIADTLALYGDVHGSALSDERGERLEQIKREKDRQFALDLYELGAISKEDLLYRLSKK